MRSQDFSNPLPLVSVLAPCRNERSHIRATLMSILGNDYPVELVEILVLDGMSTDGTRDIVFGIIEDYPQVKLIHNPGKIVPTAMNIGLGVAKGDFIVRIDCHAKFAKDYLRTCIEVIQRTGADNVGGYWETLPGAETTMARAIMLATRSSFGVGNSTFRTMGREEKEVDTVPFGTFRKTIFGKIGPYDERLVRNQDIELNSRIRKSGGKIIISPDIKLSYFNRATLKGLWQQSFNNGLWNPYTVLMTGSTLGVRHFVPLFFSTGLLALAGGSLVHGAFPPVLMGLLFLYFSCAIWAAQRQQPREAGTSTLEVMMAFFVLHFAYGLGSFWGFTTALWKFSRTGASPAGKALPDRRT